MTILTGDILLAIFLPYTITTVTNPSCCSRADFASRLKWSLELCILFCILSSYTAFTDIFTGDYLFYVLLLYYTGAFIPEELLIFRKLLIFLVIMKFLRGNCPIANCRLTALIGAEPIWGVALKSGGNCPPS